MGLSFGYQAGALAGLSIAVGGAVMWLSASRPGGLAWWPARASFAEWASSGSRCRWVCVRRRAGGGAWRSPVPQHRVFWLWLRFSAFALFALLWPWLWLGLAVLLDG